MIGIAFTHLPQQVYAVFILVFMPAAIFSAPLNVVDENAGNGIDSAEDEIILSVSTIVNGVKKSEAAAIGEELERLGDDIKSAAFEAFMLEVTQKAMTVAEVKQAVEAVKVSAKESPVGLFLTTDADALSPCTPVYGVQGCAKDTSKALFIFPFLLAEIGKYLRYFLQVSFPTLTVCLRPDF